MFLTVLLFALAILLVACAVTLSVFRQVGSLFTPRKLVYAALILAGITVYRTALVMFEGQIDAFQRVEGVGLVIIGGFTAIAMLFFAGILTFVGWQKYIAWRRHGNPHAFNYL